MSPQPRFSTSLNFTNDLDPMNVLGWSSPSMIRLKMTILMFLKCVSDTFLSTLGGPNQSNSLIGCLSRQNRKGAFPFHVADSELPPNHAIPPPQHRATPT